METILKQRVRNRKGLPVGVLVAKKMPRGNVRLGWSRCKAKADTFSFKAGLEIATFRAETNHNPPVPQSMQEEYVGFANRAIRYFFKGKNLIIKPA
jgi:hypothetical protein